MIETFFGLARLGHTDDKGMPYPLQLALSAQEFSDVIVFLASDYSSYMTGEIVPVSSQHA